jgi:excisionase family DNA binding protein
MEQDPLMTVDEVADVLRVSNMTVYRLIKAGRIPAMRVGRNFRVRRSEIVRYLESGAVSGPSAS